MTDYLFIYTSWISRKRLSYTHKQRARCVLVFYLDNKRLRDPPTPQLPHNFSLKTFKKKIICFQLNYSNATQVTLRNVDFNIRGNVSCEVTTDRRFKIDVAYDVLEVVIMPPSPPVIKVNKDRYSPGDRLTGNCTYAESKPPPKLRFLVNNRPVSFFY